MLSIIIPTLNRGNLLTLTLNSLASQDFPPQNFEKDTLFALSGFHPDCVPANLQQFQGDGETGLSIKAREKGYRAIYQPKALLHKWKLGQKSPFLSLD
jgi:GT2 family glycosyltransferase